MIYIILHFKISIWYSVIKQHRTIDKLSKDRKNKGKTGGKPNNNQSLSTTGIFHISSDLDAWIEIVYLRSISLKRLNPSPVKLSIPLSCTTQNHNEINQSRTQTKFTEIWSWTSLLKEIGFVATYKLNAGWPHCSATVVRGLNYGWARVTLCPLHYTGLKNKYLARGP